MQCKFVSPYSNTICTNPDSLKDTKVGEVLSDTSRCYDFSLLTGNDYGCFNTKCDHKTK